MYSKVARFNAVQYAKDDKPHVTTNAGSGFFYLHGDKVYFATDRRYVIMEEKAFLPDSIVIHQNNIEWQTKNTSSVAGMEISLYDKNEKPVWQVLPFVSAHDDSRMLVSIPIPQNMIDQRQLNTPEFCFIAVEQFPKEVYLSLDGKTQEIGDKDVSLSIPISAALSIADYFLYSDKSNEKQLQKKIEKQYHAFQKYNYDDEGQIIDVDFKIHRKNFARDMIEMVLVLLEQNMDKVKEKTKTQHIQDNEYDSDAKMRQEKSKEISSLLQIHSNLMRELEKIMRQFEDVLEPSIFDRMQTIFSIMMTKQNGLAGLSSLIRNESDYLIVKHLIHKILEQLGHNIVFVQ